MRSPKLRTASALLTSLTLSLASCTSDEGTPSDAADSAGTDVAADVGDTDTSAADAAVGDGSGADGDDVVVTDPDTDDDADSAADAEVGPTIDPLGWALGDPGPFSVGYRRYTLTYDRPDVAEQRTITVNVWYPTDEPSHVPVAYLDTFQDRDSNLDSPPAPPVYPSGRYPVHLHSHGFQGFGGTSAFLMRHFASHGWLAIAPDHTGNTLLDHRDPLATSHYFLKEIDLSESLDLLDELPNEDPLHGLADTSRVVVSGHSFGVYATWAISGATFDMDVIRDECASGGVPSGTCTDAELAVFEAGVADPRVVATIGLAGSYRASWFGDSGYTTLQGPFLSLSGSEDGVGADEQFATVGDSVPLWWVLLEGGCHQTFALGGCPTLDTLVGWRIVSTYSLAFARHFLLGDAGTAVTDVLDGTDPVSELATLRRSAAVTR
ncbi:MAG: hypothetical protein H6700_10215 [Myxococcales bacterium]|nr:hypothetical protein [Myxococcales bacterium]MCB9520724.1 hypothetical protein [Myxococcales bacterium]MCB9532128.1 hypothetical protein [Myxococcales bacterium]